MNPTDLDLHQTRDAVLAGEVSAADVTRAYLERCRAVNPRVNAFREVHESEAVAAAEAVDRRVADRATADDLPLAGVPLGIKDVLCTTTGTTCVSSKMLDGYRSPFDATCVARLLDAGAVMLGKTNMDEFAMGSSTETSAFGNTLNPWDPSRVPGGSSGGSAAAVAAGLCPASLGTDTGGSIRQPAALCGVVGMKPTYGRVSRSGLVAFASSLDQVGPFTRTVDDTALLLRVMSGHDPLDSTSAVAPEDPADYARTDRVPEKLRIGIAKQYMSDGANHPAVQAATEAAAEVYRAAGADVVEVDLPHTSFGIPVYYVVATAEASSNLARFDGVHFGHRTQDAVADIGELYSRSRGEGFGLEVKRRIMLGTYALSSGYYDAYYDRASRVRRLIRQDFDAAFRHCNAILCPTTTGPAFALGEKADDPLAMYLNDIYTVNANLAGIPGISLPAGTTPAGTTPAGGHELPIGIQLLGPAFGETSLLSIAKLYENAQPPWRLAPGC